MTLGPDDNQAYTFGDVRRIYKDDLSKKNFVLPEVAKKNYPKSDFHRFYIGEIVNVLSGD